MPIDKIVHDIVVLEPRDGIYRLQCMVMVMVMMMIRRNRNDIDVRGDFVDHPGGIVSIDSVHGTIIVPVHLQ